MAKYLSQEWLDEGRKLAEDQPVRPGATAKMQYVVTGGPDGDFTLTMTYDDAKKVQTGELDPNAAFMQGRMKVTGNMAKLMSLLPLTNSPEYRALQEQIREITEY